MHDSFSDGAVDVKNKAYQLNNIVLFFSTNNSRSKIKSCIIFKFHIFCFCMKVCNQINRKLLPDCLSHSSNLSEITFHNGTVKMSPILP